MTLLQVQSLHRHFGGVRALDGVGFAVAEGSVHSLIGPNGSGKSTCVNVITGIYTPNSGQVVFRGKSIGGDPTWRIARMGIARTFQTIRLFSDLDCIQNVLVGRHLHIRAGALASVFLTPAFRRAEADARAQAARWLEFVGLQVRPEVPARQLAYGQKRLLEIARALATDPKLLILDEPAAGMNPTEVKAFQSLLEKVRRLGTTVLLIEHNMALVMSVSDRVTVLNFGKRIAEGKPEEVRHQPDVVEAYLGKEVRHA